MVLSSVFQHHLGSAIDGEVIAKSHKCEFFWILLRSGKFEVHDVLMEREVVHDSGFLKQKQALQIFSDLIANVISFVVCDFELP